MYSNDNYNNREKYNCIVFLRGRSPLKYRNVSNVPKLLKWIEYNISNAWSYVNIYEKRSGNYIKRIYNNRQI